MWEVGASLARGLFWFCLYSTLLLLDAFYLGCWNADEIMRGLKYPRPALGMTARVSIVLSPPPYFTNGETETQTQCSPSDHID